MLVTPELVLTGYPPEDLLLRPLFVQTQQDVLDRLRQDLAGLAGLHVLVGHVQARQGRLYNAASVLCGAACWAPTAARAAQLFGVR